MARISLRVILPFICALLAACSTGHVAFQHNVFPGLERYDDGRIHAALTTPIVLPHQVHAAVLWLDQPANWSAVTLPESERTRLLDELARGLSAAPFIGVSVIPTTLTSNADTGVDLGDVRSAAAHLQSDVAILVLTTTTTTTDWNALALTYPALITALFVPGNDLRVDVAAQACAIDVRTGLFIDCVQGHAHTIDRFVIPTRSGAVLRALTTDAVTDALADLPQRLRAGVGARLVTAGATASANGGSGMRRLPYRTAAE